MRICKLLAFFWYLVFGVFWYCMCFAYIQKKITERGTATYSVVHILAATHERMGDRLDWVSH